MVYPDISNKPPPIGPTSNPQLLSSLK